MSFPTTNRSTRRRHVPAPAVSFGFLLCVPVLLSAPTAAAEERGMATQSASAPAPAPYVAPAPAPAPYVAPAPAPEPYVARSAPAPSHEAAPARSAPPRDSSPSPTTVSAGRSPGRSGGGGHAAPPRGREPAVRPGQGSGRSPGYVSTGPRGSGSGWGYRPSRHYHHPSWGWGTSWWWGGPWDWWWWGPGWGWGPYWGWGRYRGWGGVMAVDDGDPLPDHYARVDTDVSPETAEVWLDGTFIGSADDFDGWPDYLYLEPGKYRLEFRHPAYETLVKELEVRRGQQIDLKDDMTLLPGKNRLEAKDPERRGTPLGRVFGKPDANRDGRGDRTGRWEARDRPGRPVDVEDPDEIDEPDGPDEDVPPPARAPRPDVGQARPGVADVAPAERSRFRFEVKPADAAVWLDDRYVGTAEELAGLRRGLAVAPGKHSVTVVRPGYGTKTIDVEGKPGAAIDVVVELEK